MNQGETSRGQGLVDGDCGAQGAGPDPLTCSKRGHAALRFDLDPVEALPQPGAERVEIVLPIIEDASSVIESEQRFCRTVRRNAVSEDRGAEQHRALADQRPQMIDLLKLLAHAARQAMQHISEADGGERREIERDGGEEVDFVERGLEAREPARGALETMAIDVEKDETADS